MKKLGKHCYINKHPGMTTYHDRDGKLHRVDGPAIFFVSGGHQYRINDLIHREDGPAVQYDNGTHGWFLNGKHYTEAEFNIEMQKRKAKQ